MGIRCDICPDVGAGWMSYELWLDHLASVPHQEQVDERFSSWSEEADQRSIVIMNWPPQNMTRFEALQLIEPQFGHISDYVVHKTKKFTIVQVGRKDRVGQLLSQDHSWNGSKLELKLKTDITLDEWNNLLSPPRDRVELNLDTSDPFYKRHMDLISASANIPLNAQLQKFIDGTTLSEECLNLRRQVLYELVRVINTRFGSAQIHPFGSYITLLGDRDSDLDIYVDRVLCSSNTDDPQDMKKTVNAMSNYFRSKTVTGPFPRCKFNYVVTISATRIPIVRLRHRFSRIQIDLSFTNIISVQNSKLIDFYIRLDERVKPLMLIVRYWARFHDISGSQLLKNYGLILMVIVFLVTKGILPSVVQLQQGVRPLIIDGWNCAFNDDVEAVAQYMGIDEARRKATPTAVEILNLTLEFFKMYLQLDSQTKVISALTGRIMSRKCFWKEDRGQEDNLLPDSEFEYYHKNLAERGPLCVYGMPLCIQDPFVLNFNVSKGTTGKTYTRFRIACIYTYTRLAELLYDSSFDLMDIFIPLPHLQGSNEMGRNGKRNLRIKEENILNELLNELNLPVEDDNIGYVDRTMTIQPSDEFKDIFRRTFLGCGYGKVAVIRKGKLLWTQFIRDLLAQFFVKAFKLDVVLKEMELESNGTNGDERHGATDFQGIRKRASIEESGESGDSSPGRSSKGPPSKVSKTNSSTSVKDDVREQDQNEIDPEVADIRMQMLDNITDDTGDGCDLVFVMTGNWRIWESRKKMRDQVELKDLPRNSAGFLDPLLIEESVSELCFKNSRIGESDTEEVPSAPLFKIECHVKFHTKVKRGMFVDIEFQGLSINDQEGIIGTACDSALRLIKSVLSSIIPEYTLFRLNSLLGHQPVNKKRDLDIIELLQTNKKKKKPERM